MKLLKYLLVNSIFMLFLGISTNAQSVKRNDLMAVYIHKFTDYVEWSTNSSFYNPNEFTIIFFGKCSLENTIRTYFKSQKLNNKPIKIKSVFDVEDILNPEILFISETNLNNLNRIIEYTENKPILTISDSKGYCKKGVLINFYQYDKTLRFEMNKKALEKSKIKIYSYLFRVAKLID